MKAFVLDAQWDPRADYKPSAVELETRRANIGSSVWRHLTSSYQEIETPTPGPDDVIIKQRRVGFCGSDMHFFEHDADGYIKYPGLVRFPSVLGHELAGDVVEIGRNVTHIKVGDPVTIEDMVRCGTCYACRINQPNHCENLDEVGFSINGGFAEYVRVPARNCWNISSIRPRVKSDAELYDCGALVEPFTVVYNALYIAAGGFQPGAYAVVHGGGPIGLATVALLRACGAAKVVVFEVTEQRRALAMKMGADAAFDPTAVNAVEVVMTETDGLGADLQVEAAGAFTHTFPVMELSTSLLGKIVVIGRDAARVSIYPEPLQVKRAILVLAKGNAGMGIYPNVLRLMAAGRINPLPMVTAKFPFGQIPTALETSRARGHGKILIDVA